MHYEPSLLLGVLVETRTGHTYAAVKLQLVRTHDTCSTYR